MWRSGLHGVVGRWRWMAIAASLFSGCAAVGSHGAPEADAESDPVAARAWAGASAGAWVPHVFPGKNPSSYRYVRLDAREAVNAQADSSASMLRRHLRVEPADLAELRFSWKVPALIEQADLAVREQDDSPARLVLAFEGDRDRLSAGDRALSELGRLLTGEEMPYATLMYVWCNRREPGSVVINPRTGRVRAIVVESGPTHLNQWRQYTRDIRADFVKAFGEAPGALVGIGLMTDSDNTRSRAQAWYGPVSLQASEAAARTP